MQRMCRHILHATLASGCALLAGANRAQSALDSAGPQAARIEWLWWLFFWVCVPVWVLVMVFLLIPLWRNRATRRRRITSAAEDRGSGAIDPPVTSPPPDRERRM